MTSCYAKGIADNQKIDGNSTVGGTHDWLEETDGPFAKPPRDTIVDVTDENPPVDPDAVPACFRPSFILWW